ncbi:RNA polymerase III C11 subunit [Ciborinia camelliae]|nr:RNA polymerase III C11 subunit [Ciborinia camelliae]
MLLFCPSCSNILTVSVTPHSSTPTPTSTSDLTGANRLECLTCPYQYILTRSIYDRKTFVREEKEDVFGGKDAWANADTYPKQCANSECNGMVAAARFVQIRSADEPMTGFYRCMTWSQRNLHEGTVTKIVSDK